MLGETFSVYIAFFCLNDLSQVSFLPSFHFLFPLPSLFLSRPYEDLFDISYILRT